MFQTRREERDLTPTRSLQRLALLLALALPATLQAAEIYRWVDSQGLVHYGSVAPHGFVYERIDTRAGPRGQATLANPRAAANTTEQATETPQPDRATAGGGPPDADLGLTEEQRERQAQLQAEAESRRARLETERTAQCERARRHYEELTTHTRVRVKDDSGRERLLSDAELQTRIAAARDGIVTNCD